MWNALRPIFIIIAVFIGIAILLLIGHEIIEARMFRMLSNQPGVRISIGAKHGSLFSGYELTDVEITQTAAHEDASPGRFATPRLTVHWQLRPFALTEITWEEGSIAFLEDNAPEEFRIGGGSLVPDGEGWLRSDEIDIGPATWGGRATIGIRADGKLVRGEISIDRLPAEIVRAAGTVPEGFILPPSVIVELRFEGEPGRLRATGSVSNPLTRESYRF